jgi:hypothetical protein
MKSNINRISGAVVTDKIKDKLLDSKIFVPNDIGQNISTEIVSNHRKTKNLCMHISELKDYECLKNVDPKIHDVIQELFHGDAEHDINFSNLNISGVASISGNTITSVLTNTANVISDLKYTIPSGCVGTIVSNIPNYSYSAIQPNNNTEIEKLKLQLQIQESKNKQLEIELQIQKEKYRHQELEADYTFV